MHLDFPPAARSLWWTNQTCHLTTRGTGKRLRQWEKVTVVSSPAKVSLQIIRRFWWFPLVSSAKITCFCTRLKTRQSQRLLFELLLLSRLFTSASTTDYFFLLWDLVCVFLSASISFKCSSPPLPFNSSPFTNTERNANTHQKRPRRSFWRFPGFALLTFFLPIFQSMWSACW